MKYVNVTMKLCILAGGKSKGKQQGMFYADQSRRSIIPCHTKFDTDCIAEMSNKERVEILKKSTNGQETNNGV